MPGVLSDGMFVVPGGVGIVCHRWERGMERWRDDLVSEQCKNPPTCRLSNNLIDVTLSFQTFILNLASFWSRFVRGSSNPTTHRDNHKIRRPSPPRHLNATATLILIRNRVRVLPSFTTCTH